jgi:hypothetical protein
MPTPLDNIKKGILTQNWTLVDKGYKGLTGESALPVSTPVRKPKTKKVQPKSKPEKKVKQQVETNVVEVIEPNSEIELVDYSGEIIDLGETKQRRQASLETVRIAKKNKFVDKGTDCLDDRDFDKKIIAKRTERRPPQGKLIITCDECGRTYKVPEGQIYSVGSYVCPPCMKRKYTGR